MNFLPCARIARGEVAQRADGVFGMERVWNKLAWRIEMMCYAIEIEKTAAGICDAERMFEGMAA